MHCPSALVFIIGNTKIEGMVAYRSVETTGTVVGPATAIVTSGSLCAFTFGPAAIRQYLLVKTAYRIAMTITLADGTKARI
jgi:hypothetical protein